MKKFSLLFIAIATLSVSSSECMDKRGQNNNDKKPNRAAYVIGGTLLGYGAYRLYYYCYPSNPTITESQNPSANITTATSSNNNPESTPDNTETDSSTKQKNPTVLELAIKGPHRPTIVDLAIKNHQPTLSNT